MSTPRPFAAARMHLTRCREALDALRNATSFSAASRAWSSYLIELQRVWNKAIEDGKKRHTRFHGWRSNGYGKLRNRDPLLSYLHHARNSDEHTLVETLQEMPGRMQINPADPFKPMLLRNLTLTQQGAFVDGDNVAIDVRPPTAVLVLAIDKGISYHPPTIHDGKALPSQDPVTVAEFGLAFYLRFVEDAEREFP